MSKSIFITGDFALRDFMSDLGLQFAEAPIHRIVFEIVDEASPGTLRLRSERKGNGNGRIYLIIAAGTNSLKMRAPWLPPNTKRRSGPPACGNS